jgi:hypothetical protein
VTSRAATLALETVLVACFLYLALHKPYGTGLWAGVVGILLAAGIPFSRRFGPEVQEVRRSDYPLDMVLALSEVEGPVEIHLRRPGEPGTVAVQRGSVFVTFFSPRQPIPERWGSSHYRFAIQGGGVYRSITALLALVQEELGGRPVVIHLGWPTSSWLDRMATGVFVWNVLRLPRTFPKLSFKIEYPASPQRDVLVPAPIRRSASVG